MTSSPGPAPTGIDSPVTRLRSTELRPSTTTPSVAIFSPGRTTKWSPTTSSSIGTRSSLVARVVGSIRRTATSLAPISSREVSADRPAVRARDSA